MLFRSCLKGHEVTNTALIEPATVVDDEHIPALRALERLEEDIHTSHVPRGQRTAGEAHPGLESLQLTRRAPHVDPDPNASIRDVRCSQEREPIFELDLVHESTLADMN